MLPDLMNRQERINFEMAWCKSELQNLRDGLNSEHTEDYLLGAIASLNFVLELENERVYK
jgi:hypothetical protein